ncbi:MAG TPA: type II toxin-antitoxin system VapC family toxin [Longimicrobium sp.]|nr:type II toxin-antitoxin system VapC family toxin [Longimicrobium sp.]
MLYLDACAAIKRYVDERDGATAVMEQVMVDAGRWGGVVSSGWLTLEFTSALTRKLRGGHVVVSVYSELLYRFRSDMNATHLVPVDNAAVEAATHLMERVRGVTRFHSGDALHLHTARQIRSDLGETETLVLVTADDGLKAVAASHAIRVFDPRTDPIADLAQLCGG